MGLLQVFFHEFYKIFQTTFVKTKTLPHNKAILYFLFFSGFLLIFTIYDLPRNFYYFSSLFIQIILTYLQNVLESTNVIYSAFAVKIADEIIFFNSSGTCYFSRIKAAQEDKSRG